MNTTSLHAIALLVFTITLSACGGTEDGPESTAAPATSTTVIAPTLAPPSAQALPGAIAVSDPNPAHGEPGHRCEIAVGASLSGAPASGAAVDAAPQTSPMFNNTTAPVTFGGAPTTTAPGMNPPHGEPGHDCAVAVGSPLPK